MPNVYATRSDLYRYGLPRGLLGNPARLCASVLASSDTFELDEHGFALGDPLLLRADQGGAMPAPLAPGVTVYAIPLSDSSFQVAAAPAGAAVDLTTDGESVLVATPLPIDEVLEFYSRFVDPFLPAHLVPLDAPYPITVTAIVAELAAKKLLLIAHQRSEAMTETEISAKAQLERWAAAIPLRDVNATGPANLAYGESVPVPVGGRDWGPPGVLP